MKRCHLNKELKELGDKPCTSGRRRSQTEGIKGQEVISGNVNVHLKTDKEPNVAGAR